MRGEAVVTEPDRAVRPELGPGGVMHLALAVGETASWRASRVCSVSTTRTQGWWRSRPRPTTSAWSRSDRAQRRRAGPTSRAAKRPSCAPLQHELAPQRRLARHAHHVLADVLRQDALATVAGQGVVARARWLTMLGAPVETRRPRQAFVPPRAPFLLRCLGASVRRELRSSAGSGHSTTSRSCAELSTSAHDGARAVATRRDVRARKSQQGLNIRPSVWSDGDVIWEGRVRPRIEGRAAAMDDETNSPYDEDTPKASQATLSEDDITTERTMGRRSTLATLGAAVATITGILGLDVGEAEAQCTDSDGGRYADPAGGGRRCRRRRRRARRRRRCSDSDGGRYADPAGRGRRC